VLWDGGIRLLYSYSLSLRVQAERTCLLVVLLAPWSNQQLGEPPLSVHCTPSQRVSGAASVPVTARRDVRRAGFAFAFECTPRPHEAYGCDTHIIYASSQLGVLPGTEPEPQKPRTSSELSPDTGGLVA